MHEHGAKQRPRGILRSGEGDMGMTAMTAMRTVHEGCCVVLRGLGYIGAENEALSLGENHAFHRWVCHAELAE